MSNRKNAMLRTIAALCLTAILLIPTTGVAAAQPPHASELITYVDSPGIGDIAVRLRVPETSRYPEGAPIVLNVATFFTPRSGFGASYNQLPDTMIGAIEVAILWPGEHDSVSGATSDGVYDYGGPDCMAALRDSIRFISGLIPNIDGQYIEDLLGVTPLTDNVGLYAFSHPGIAATNVLAYHGLDLPKVKYIVTRESPTLPAYSAIVGYWDEHGEAVLNPYYTYPDDYSPTTLDIDYSTVGWLQNGHYPEGRPFFAVPNDDDYILGPYGAEMFGKRYYALELTQALYDNDVFGGGPWPADVATVTETLEAWPYRTTVYNYPILATTAPDLKVMLVFAKDDHAQADPAKYHIHQTYDGFRNAAGFWVRMNPDRAYVQQTKPGYPLEAFPDNEANREPVNWMGIRGWGYPNIPDAQLYVSLAAVAEMADRVRADNWDDNLDEVLVEYPPSQPTPRRVYLPLLTKDWFGEPTVITDVTFAVVEGESLALDAYLPATPGPHPAVILIHGGYWQAGDKESHSRLGEWMAEHGYAAFAINYRLAPEFPFPAAVADVQCAIAWVREHAAEYDVDPDRIALMGTSAGGHLAALAGLAAIPASPAASWQPSCGDPTANVEVQAIISCFGPVDLAFHAQESEGAGNIVTVFLGGQACQDAPQLCAAASPMTYVTADAPPTLLVHGTDDDVVSCENSARLYAALDGIGADVTYLPVEGAQHGFIIGVQSPKAQTALDAVEDFLPIMSFEF